MSENKIDVLARIDMTPELLAAAFWGMGNDEQAAFFAELWRIAGYRLCLQTAWINNAISERADRGDYAAMNAFRTMADHAEAYPEAAASWRAANAKAAIARVAANARHKPRGEATSA